MSKNICLLFHLIAFLSLGISFSIENSCEIDDDCVLPNGEQGIAKLDKDCEYSLELWYKNRQEYFNHVCGRTVSIKEIVCCPLKSKAEKACKNFRARPKKEVPPRVVIVDHILGGSDAELAAFPFFAALAYQDFENGQVRYDCGGVLISNKFILTAAHCCNRKNQLPKFVRLGKTSLNDSFSIDYFKAVEISVKNITHHPSYSNKKKDHDIALLELKESVTFKYNIFPACLSIPPRDTSKLIIGGFGKHTTDTDETPLWLKTAVIKEVQTEACNEKFKKSYNENVIYSAKLSQGITKNVICAGGTGDGVDTCQGDSGSGLMKEIEGKFYVYGITSVGVACGNYFVPSFYTRVSEYLPWIESVVWP